MPSHLGGRKAGSFNGDSIRSLQTASLFGGCKNSLFGDYSMYGPDGVAFYTRQKVVTSRWPDPALSEVDLGFPRTR